MSESKSRKKTPAKAAAAPRKVSPTRVTSEDEWLSASEGQLLEMPSGKVVRVRMPGLAAFIAADLIPNELMPIVLGAVNGQQEPDTEEIKKIQRDPQMLLQLSITMDRIFCYCITEPKFHMVPTVEREGREIFDYDSKEQGKLYVDIVDDLDKTYIFNVAVGGTRDLERFRKEQAQELAALQAG